MKSILISFFLLISVSVSAQDDWTYSVKGTVKQDSEKMEGAIVTLYKNGSQVSQQVTKKNGSFGFVLEPNNIYILAVGAPGFITKKIEFDTRNVPTDRGKYGFGTFIIEQISIFEIPPNMKDIPKLDSCFNKPLGRVTYIKEKEDFGYDLKYAGEMSDCLKKLRELQKKCEGVVKYPIDSLSKPQKDNDPKREQEIDEKYKEYISKADEFFKTGDYAKAKINYNMARAIKPYEKYPQGQIKICDTKLSEGSGDKMSDTYKDAIAKADKFFAIKDYANARDAYSLALKIRPQEQYPKLMIEKCDQNLQKQNINTSINQEQSMNVKTKKMASFPDTIKDVFYIIDTAKTGALVKTKRNEIFLVGRGSGIRKGYLPDSVYKNYTGVYFEEWFKNDSITIKENELVSYNSVLNTSKSGTAGNCVLKKGVKHLFKINNKVFYFTTNSNYNFLLIRYMNGEIILIYTNNAPIYK